MCCQLDLNSLSNSLDTICHEKADFKLKDIRNILLNPKNILLPTTQKMQFSLKDFFSKCDKIRKNVDYQKK